MQIPRGLDDILGKIGNNVKGNFEKFKNKIGEFPKYLDERIKEIRDKTYIKLKEYMPIIGGAAITALPLYAKAPILTGLHIKNLYKGTGGKLLGYGLIGAGVAIAVGLGIVFGLNAIHSLPSNHIEYLGSSNGYEAFVPHDTINYNGHTDPTGDLILNNGNTVHDVIWDGQYSNTIIQNHNQIVQLNNQFVGQTDPVNNQQYVPLQDLYVIKGQVPIEQVTINGQTYYVIEASSINPANIAGFYTYSPWVPNFEVAMNTPGTYAAGLPGNSPVYNWANITGTLVYETHLYQDYIRGFFGGAVLVQPNGTIIPYGINTNIPTSAYFSNFTAPSQVYNTSS
ncbi:MAG: hypothetical protein RXQ77_03115 [Candidatus Nanopusillus sp.]